MRGGVTLNQPGEASLDPILTLPGREPGVMLAYRKLGWSGIGRAAGVRKQSVTEWRRVPREHVFAVAAAAGVEPEELRPDLAAWVEAERERKWMERARERFAISTGMQGGTATVRSIERPDPRTLDLLDLGLVMAALRFVARERRLKVPAILAAPIGGTMKRTPEQSARSWAAALAVVVGRVNSETVAGVVGLTRQAVDNATERYLRRRDGDDPELIDAEGWVWERGRRRVPKQGDPEAWAAQRRFVKQLAGGDA
jgi:hypothetical protein